MNNYILATILLLSSSFISCNKCEPVIVEDTDCIDNETSLGGLFNGYASGLIIPFDEFEKPLLGHVRTNVENDKINLIIRGYNTHGVVKDSILLTNIPLKKGKYVIKNNSNINSTVGLTFNFTYFSDTLQYMVDESSSINELDLLYLDADKRIAKIRYQFDLITDNDRCTLYSLEKRMKFRNGISEFRY